jgi:hypothetical protein
LAFGACTATGLGKNVADTSSASVGAAGNLYVFTNSNSANTGGVLKLDNGTNTGSTLTVTASGNPTASLIFASNTNASPTGNLIDLQAGSSPTSKFLVTAAGNGTFVGTIGGTTLNGTTGINTGASAGTQRIDSSGNLVNIGNLTGSGAVTISSGGATALNLDTGGAAAINIGATNATSVVIGTSNSTGTLLTLDTDTDATYDNGTATNAPAEVDGAMFYSSTNHSFLCGVAGSWETCTGLLYSNTAASTGVASCTTACVAFNKAVPIPANYCKAGRVINVKARGIWTTATTTMAFGVYYGTDASVKTNDTLLGAATQTSSSVVAAAWAWHLDIDIVCFSTTSMMVEVRETLQDATAAAGTTLKTYALPTAAATTVTSTSAKNIYIFPAFGANAAGNNATLQQLSATGY